MANVFESRFLKFPLHRVHLQVDLLGHDGRVGVGRVVIGDVQRRGPGHEQGEFL